MLHSRENLSDKNTSAQVPSFGSRSAREDKELLCPSEGPEVWWIREQTKQELLQYASWILNSGQHPCRGFSHLRWGSWPWNKTTAYDRDSFLVCWSLEEENAGNIFENRKAFGCSTLHVLVEAALTHQTLGLLTNHIFWSTNRRGRTNYRRLAWRIRLFGWRIIVFFCQRRAPTSVWGLRLRCEGGPHLLRMVELVHARSYLRNASNILR